MNKKINFMWKSAIVIDKPTEGAVYFPKSDEYASCDNIDEIKEYMAENGIDDPYCFDCSIEHFKLHKKDVLDMIEGAIEYDGYEADDWENNINDIDELCNFVKEWNKKQTLYQYVQNHNKIIVIDKERFRHLSYYDESEKKE